MMGDISAEPSMEEILSSIKRIIAEEGDSAVASRARRGRTAPAPKPAPFPEDDRDEVLELRELVEEDMQDAEHDWPEEAPMAMGTPTPPRSPKPQPARGEPILSDRAAEATRGPLEALSRMIVRPEVQGSDTLEGMVRDMLKPMLRDWLDANLPQIVETMVAREIERITERK